MHPETQALFVLFILLALAIGWAAGLLFSALKEGSSLMGDNAAWPDPDAVIDERSLRAGVTHYVAGFLFSPDKRTVLLIRKKRPDWQKGKLNGVGGRIEPGETPLEAMIREFEEETLTHLEDWTLTARLTHASRNGIVYFFAAVASENLVSSLYAVEGMSRLREAMDPNVELLDTVSVIGISDYVTVPNLRWLIPQALDVLERRSTEGAVLVPTECWE